MPNGTGHYHYVWVGDTETACSRPIEDVENVVYHTEDADCPECVGHIPHMGRPEECFCEAVAH